MGAVPESVAVEARAKNFWGARPDTVLQFLKSNNVGENDARALIEAVLTERAESVRRDGVTKIWSGALLVMVPIAYFFGSWGLLGFVLVKLLVALGLVGLFGLARLAKGLSMAISPRSVSGDLSNPADF
ncbi:hypothetical protein [Frigoriglobus tundricola]|uniref:Uncharacterized protein n=1 Tax=Frigoriglobus tundricola TaxID=2774151 RepID=A0A6M5YRG6_9BACT|nr:hypothetical protein [Frigoriglobus tundricola]QJW96677.1 hypothetical protein FTUN_4234 [Frigoriglobus tundricola]